MVVGRESDVATARALWTDLSRLADMAKKQALLVVLHDFEHREPRRTAVWTESIGAERLFHIRTRREVDYGRLGAILCGRAVGLVLGGGFARGLGHIGVIRAMRELEIPIDMVGGTSMGAIIAGQCAIEWDWPRMLDVTMHRSAASLKGDFTLPLVSLMTGKKFSKTIQEIADGRDVEDAWLPSFCISANLANGQMKVHKSGDAAKSVIASARVPVVFPPLSWGDDLLVDGELVNMVPAKYMRDFSNDGIVISVDCSAQAEFRAPDFGASHSGWKELWRRLKSGVRGRPAIGVMGILLQALEFGRATSPIPTITPTCTSCCRSTNFRTGTLWPARKWRKSATNSLCSDCRRGSRKRGDHGSPARRARRRFAMTQLWRVPAAGLSPSRTGARSVLPEELGCVWMPTRSRL